MNWERKSTVIGEFAFDIRADVQREYPICWGPSVCLLANFTSGTDSASYANSPK